jgi:UDP-N-acetylmuramoyl-tripeptide--D-alanyl-D-alanine ligase
MKPLSIRQIRQVVGGKALSPIAADAPTVVAVCTDTRRMEKSSLFIALRGDNFNGNDFLPDAVRGGAIAALVDTIPTESFPNVLLIQVPDTRIAMRKLANYCRTQMRAKVVGVAGSNGKTSTKHLIDAALSGKLRGSISPKNWNNDIGVPLTIFPADPLQDYIVLEMGTNHHGEIRILSEMAMPDIAVITNCGADHLEFLDDTMGVRRENACIVSGLKPSGLLVVNGDDADLLAAVAEYKGQRVTFGLSPSNDLFATDIRVEEAGTKFSLNNSRREVFVPMLGAHSACNALAAIAVARKLGVPEDVIITSLATARGPEMRLQWQVHGDIRVLNDAYNANPDSMRAALETVAALPCNGRRIAVLGDMRELGPKSERYHREIGQLVASAKAFDALICVGQDATFIAEAALAGGFASDAIWRFADSASASSEVPAMIRGGDLVLLKASRGVRLEALANAMAGKSDQQARLVAS